MTVRCIRIHMAAVCAATLLATACGGRENTPASQLKLSPAATEQLPVPLASGAPVMPVLERQLSAELARLGKEAGRHASAAPLGKDNSIFDLVVSYYDLQQGAVLHWTERHVGDYDMNGLVNAADLTPLAQRWDRRISYRPVSEGGGVTWWPAGNPRDGGLAAVLGDKPGFDTPADQWRTARVDGDGNGIISLGDVTPIAVHWQQRLDGYRVYRRAPGETEFTLLAEDAAGFSMPRSAQFPLGKTAPDNSWAYRLHFADLDISPGTFAYYVAPYDSETATEGTPSRTVEIEFAEGDPPPPPPGNRPPVITLVVDNPKGDLPLTVDFDASGSYDPDGEIVQYIWDWEGDGVADFTSSNSPLASHAYTQQGYFQPRLTIWDDQGGSDTESLTVRIAVGTDGRLPPEIELFATPLEGFRPLDVNFTTVLDLHGGYIGDLSFAWDFNGDGERDSTAKPLPEGVDYTFWDHGTFVASVEGKDGYGLSDSDMIVINVLANADPVATLVADQTAITAGTQVNFSAAGSADSDDTELSFSWDFDGNGVFEKETGDKRETYTEFVFAGAYTSTVKVSDEHGAFGTASVDILVAEKENLPPVVDVVVTPDPQAEGLPVNIDMSGTYDGDDHSFGGLQYSLDFDNDGIYDLVTEKRQVEHTFTTAGIHPLVVRVLDVEGLEAKKNVDVTIVSNEPPQAELSATRLGIHLPTDVEFDASASSDPDGDELSFAWDYHYYPGDDTYVEGFAKAYYTYDSAGTHVCRVRVTDKYGESSYASIETVCTGPGWQIRNIANGYSDVDSPAIALELVGNRPAIACTFTEGLEGQPGAVLFSRAADSQGLAWGSPLTIHEPGDADDDPLAVALALNGVAPMISWQQSNGPTMFRRSTDANGSSWIAPVIVHADIPGKANGTELLMVLAKPSLGWIDNSGMLRFSRSDDTLGNSWQSQQQLELVQDQGWNNSQTRLAIADKYPVMSYVNTELEPSVLRFRRALDKEAESWGDPVDLANPAYIVRSAAMTVVDDRPIVAYYTSSGLWCRAATDATGSLWHNPRMVSSQSGSGLLRRSEICMVDFNGVPALLDERMRLWIAGDAIGGSWSGGEDFPDGFLGDTFDLAIVDGKPAIAFQDDNVFYAIKLD